MADIAPSMWTEGRVPGALFAAANDALSTLSTPRGTALALRRLEAVLRSAQRRADGHDALATAIERDAPEYAELAAHLRAARGWTVNQWLGIVLPLIAVRTAQSRSHRDGR
jgi:hypothetical protein